MRWLLLIGVAWPVLAVLVALVLGGAIRLADRRAEEARRLAEDAARDAPQSPTAGRPNPGALSRRIPTPRPAARQPLRSKAAHPRWPWPIGRSGLN